MSEHEVVIVGAGPTGLMLAGELKLAGIDVVIIERRANQHVDGSRARGLHSRAVEVLDQRGIADRFISEGQQHPSVGFGGISLDISDFPTRHNYLLALLQSKFEPILADWVGELGVPIIRSREVTSFTQDDSGVTIEVSDGQSLRADYLVGCDGGRSLIRKIAGIDFPGLDASISYIIAEVKMDKEPEFGTRPEGGGIGKAADGESIGVVVGEKVVKHADEPSMDELREYIVGMLSGLDIHYDLGEGHPLLGRRLPDLDLQIADGPTRVFSLLHDAKAVLLNLGEADGFDISAWSIRVRLVTATYEGTWELPVLGEVTSPSAVLIRPDGYVAWTGHVADPELPQVLTTWFGVATPA